MATSLLHGLAFDSVVNAGFLPPDPADIPRALAAFWVLHESAISRYRARDAILTAFISTLTAGLDADYQPASHYPGRVSDFRSYVLDAASDAFPPTDLPSLFGESPAPSRSALAARAASGGSRRFALALRRAGALYKGFVTSRGYLGIGPQMLQPDDSICMPFGGPVLLALRQCGARYRLLGECYVEGIIREEATTGWREGQEMRERRKEAEVEMEIEEALLKVGEFELV